MANSTDTKPVSATKVITGKVRFSYLNVFKPASVNGSDPKYSVALLIPKSDTATLAKIKAAINAAYEEGKDQLKGVTLAKLKTPLRDGDEERPDDEAYAGHYFINANSNKKPQVVDKNLEEIIDQADLYSGCYGRASVNFYAFNTNGNKGVAAGLNNLQKLADGEPLAGGASAKEDFSDDFDDDLM